MKFPPLLLAWCMVLPVHGAENALVDTTGSPHAVMHMPGLADVKWTGGLLGARFEVCRSVMVPHLWEILSSEQNSHAWHNFLIAAGEAEGKFRGPPFNDGDFLKWFEALAQVYAVTKDADLDAQMDRIIAVIAKAQREDGYLHTQTIIPQRQGDPKAKEFADREHFETYNMGHLMTAACIHYRATGKTSMLGLARKAADYIDRLCRERPAELARNAICPSHYMGVVELYRATREPRYLELARQLIEIRSLVPPEAGSDQNQDRMPFREMTQAVGHAVRANYLYAGVADLAAENGDATLLRTLKTLSENVAGRKLYVTGMTGALYDGASPDGVDHRQHKYIKTVHQAYGREYELPNLTAYNETCANIGYALWMWRMLALTGDAAYADLFEQTLYNGVLPGISLDGKDYFYVNALRKLRDFDVPLRWSRTRQPNISSSFCCPPNVVRTIAEMHNYVYALSPGKLWVNLYGASTLDTAWGQGGRIRLRQETDYPWSGSVRIVLEEAPGDPVALQLRIPGWLKPGAAHITINGSAVTPQESMRAGTYTSVARQWKAGDVITLEMQFAPVLLEANPRIEETLNQVAVRCGPIIFCAESNDLPPDVRLNDVAVSLARAATETKRQREALHGAEMVTLTLPAVAAKQPAWRANELYREMAPPETTAIALKLVPYFSWGNRGDGDMTVWLPVR